MGFQPKIEKIVRNKWDVFATRGFCKSIRGFNFRIDTGTAKKIC